MQRKGGEGERTHRGWCCEEGREVGNGCVQGCQCLSEPGQEKLSNNSQIMGHPDEVIKSESTPGTKLRREDKIKEGGQTPCLFVLCKRHCINRVPGAHRGDSLCIRFTLTLTLAMQSYL